MYDLLATCSLSLSSVCWQCSMQATGVVNFFKRKKPNTVRLQVMLLFGASFGLVEGIN